MNKPYSYVGPHELRQLLAHPAPRTCVQRPADVRVWITQTHQHLDRDKTVTATFIIAVDGLLWIADRHSEHVVCARGEPVRTAGEITFTIHKDQVAVVAVTNQSTGYCPEPESWPAVAVALERIPLQHPETWTMAYTFRRCMLCSTINIVKDSLYECTVCQTPLPQHWNF